MSAVISPSVAGDFGVLQDTKEPATMECHGEVKKVSAVSQGTGYLWKAVIGKVLGSTWWRVWASLWKRVRQFRRTSYLTEQ